MDKALTMLSDEHQNILTVIDALLKECNSIESGNSINKDFFKKAIDFVRGYADTLHHAKEEDVLFVELDDAEMHCNPMEQMRHEHELGRNFIRELETIKSETISELSLFVSQSKNRILQEKLAIVRKNINKIDTSNLNDQTISRFLVVSKLKSELLEKAHA